MSRLGGAWKAARWACRVGVSGGLEVEDHVFMGILGGDLG